MKTYKFFAIAMAAVATASCAKEIAQTNAPEENLNLSPLTLSACTGEEDTKAGFSETAYPVIEWKANDAISILGTATGNQKFTTNAAGASVEFSGFAALTDETLYAVYPYDEALSLNGDGTIANASVPALQTAAAGSFDPKAYMAIAKCTDKTTLEFKAMVTFFKFKVADAANVKSVTIKGNNAENMACTATLDYEALSHKSPYVDGTTSEFITLTGTFENGKEYFAIARPNTYQNGITVYVQYTDGTVKSGTTTNQVFASGSRNHIKNLGTLAPTTEVNDLYMLYNMGLDIEIAGMTINKTKYPTVKTLTASEADTAIGGINADCVTFITQNEAASFKLSGNIAINGDVILINRYKDETVNIKTNGKYFQGNKGSLVLSNITFDATNSSVFIRNYGGTESMDKIIVDNCKISHVGQDFIKLTQREFTVADIRIHNSDIGFSYTTSPVYLIENNQTVTFNTVDLYNNILFCERGEENTEGNVVGTLFSNTSNSQNASITKLRIVNNTIVGLYPSNTTHYVMVNEFNEIEQKGNYFHLPAYYNFVNYTKDDGTEAKYTLSIVKAKKFASIENVDVERGYVYYDETVGTPTTLKAFSTDYAETTFNPYLNKTSLLTIDWDMETFVCSNPSYGAQRTLTGTQALSERQTWNGVSAWN